MSTTTTITTIGDGVMVSDDIYNMDDIMQNQAVINIGMIGHVANGKTTITEFLTGITTTKHSSEKIQNKTIRLGYANVKIWRCIRCNAYEATGSDKFSTKCDCRMSQSKNLIMHFSIVDCPGHDVLVSTMLNGSSVMDYTILVESVENKDCPAPQTAEHFRATQIAGIPNAMIIMNKIDVQKRSKIVDRIAKLENYIREETGYTNNTNTIRNDRLQPISPIVPISATFGTNMDVVCEYLSKLSIPATRDLNGVFEMLIIRSFDVNRPGISNSKKKENDNDVVGGTDVRKIKGGVIGGSIARGKLALSDKLIILPGIHRRLSKEEKDSLATDADYGYTPILCTVKTIQSEKNDIKFAVAGGLMAIQVSIDPSHARNDGLSGSIVLKEIDYLSAIKQKNMEYRVYDKIIVKMESFMNEVSKIKAIFAENTVIKINVNSNTIKAMVLKYSKNSQELRLILVKPIPITSLNGYVTVMFDKTIQKNDPINTTSVIGAGRIIDGVEAVILE